MTEEAGIHGKPPALAREQQRQSKVTIKTADMKEEMQKAAVDRALAALEKHSVEKDIAAYIKKEFDRMYGSTWHCIVGRNFGNDRTQRSCCAWRSWWNKGFQHGIRASGLSHAYRRHRGMKYSVFHPPEVAAAEIPAPEKVAAVDFLATAETSFF